MAAQTKGKKRGFFKRLGSFFVKSWSELKKVSWPTFRTVVKSTIIVLLVVVAFSVIVFGLDSLFGFLLSLVSKAQCYERNQQCKMVYPSYLFGIRKLGKKEH